MIGICGASGYIGSRLFQYLHDQGEKVMGTYCNCTKKGLARYDLRTDRLSFFDDCSYVVVCAAYVKIRFCEINKMEAYWLNVYRTRELLEHLSNKGISALFISSDAAARHDTTYGKYKKLVEKYIRQDNLKVQVIRPGKINEDNIDNLCEGIYAYIKLRRRKKTSTKRGKHRHNAVSGNL